MITTTLERKLELLCQQTGAEWVVFATKEVHWIIKTKNLSHALHRTLSHYLRNDSVTRWIDDAYLGEKVKTKILYGNEGLSCKRIFVFPIRQSPMVMLVGVNEISASSKKVWEVIGLTSILSPDLSKKPNEHIFPKSSIDISSHSPDALDQVLRLMKKTLGSSSEWLAIRSGDHLDVKASSTSVGVVEKDIAIDANPLIREIMRDGRLGFVGSQHIEWAMVPRIGIGRKEKYWVGLPIIIGKRSIGLIGLSFERKPQNEKIKRALALILQLSGTVEGNVIFEDLSHHLRRMALLNDFSATISTAVDVGQIVKRLFTLMKRAFGTDRITLMTRMLDGSIFHHYSLHGDSVISQTMTVVEAKEYWPISDKETIRVQPERSINIHPFHEDSASILIVPMRIQKELLGMLRLESTRENAFSGDDQNLLAVFASHLAGLVENGRLRKEAEARARNLSLIHSVVEHVIGSNDVVMVAQQAAELIAKYFSYELAGIALLDSEKQLRLVGIGGGAANVVKAFLGGKETNSQQGIVGRVMVTGQSLIINDVNQDPIYLPLPGWDAGSEMCVPLKDGENILGVIDVESQRKNAFTNSDLLVLESLAGILASVIISASQYQKLQLTVTQLQNTRMELQERIAAQKMAESRLVQAAKLAAVGEMAAGIAHELNNPLTTVAGFTELALESLNDKPVREDLELVLREAQRARGVVRRLLDFARQSESVRTRSDVNEIIIDAINLTKHLLHTSGILLNLNLADDLPWPSVDRNQLKQVILNLIHNSMHAMPAGGTLSIISKIHHHNDQLGVSIIIKDSGIGIPPDQLERIFEPFFTTRSKEGGTGLGLSVSYGIVADHKGDIFVESVVGEGSTFTIWLPTEDV